MSNNIDQQPVRHLGKKWERQLPAVIAFHDQQVSEVERYGLAIHHYLPWSRRPGEWQSYQIWFRGPRFDPGGKKIENARFIRVLYNGLSVQNNVEVEGGTRAHMEIPEAARNPIMLQGDHGPVAYRNIYIRPMRPIIER